MTCQHPNTLSLESVPHIACPVIVTTEKDPSRDGERNGRYATKYIIVRECVQFAVGSNIEETTRSVIRTGREGITIREEPKVNEFPVPAPDATRNTHT